MDDLPNKVYLELTTECNLDCAMCIRHSWADEGGRMSDRTFEAALAGIVDMPSITTVSLSGFGEAMVHPAFWDVLARLKDAGLYVEVISNGLTLDGDAARRLIDLKLDKIIVSVDGVGEQSDQLLHAGLFPTVSNNLKGLNVLRQSLNVTYPEIGLEFVATKRNIHELVKLKRLSWPLGFSTILVTNVIPHTPELAADTLYEHWNTASRTRAASPWAVTVDLPVMDPQAQVGRAIQRLSNGGAKVLVNGAEVLGAPPQCRFITEGRFAIRWDGQVSPCLHLLHEHTYFYRGRAKHVVPYHLGNVTDRALGEIWRSDEYTDFRRRVRDFEFSPCLDCGDCDLRSTNEEDCTDDQHPRCGECLWAAGLIQCP